MSIEVDGLTAKLIDAMPLMVVVTRKEDGQILYANRRAANLVGETDGVPISNFSRDYFVRPAERDAAVEALKLAGTLDHYEAEVVSADGSPVAVCGFAGMLDHDGEELIVAGFADTRRQDMVAQYRQLAYRLEALRRIAAGVAHQLSNALVPVMTFSELARTGRPTQDVLDDYLARIAAGADRCVQLINDIREFSRVRGSEIQRIDLATAVDHCQSVLANILPQQIRLDCRLCGEALPILADPRLLEDVIIGTVLNAGDEIGRRPGRIEITAGRMPPRGKPECAAITITIASRSGPGQEASPGVRGAGKGGATGHHGIAIETSRDIVREMMGCIEVTHTASHSMIELRFPLQRSDLDRTRA